MSSEGEAEPSEEVRLLRAEFERLGRERAVLERQWRLKHRLALFALAALPVYLVAGRFWAGMVLLMIPPLIATQAYLLAVRRRELGDLIAETKADLAALARARPDEADDGRPSLWRSKRPLLGGEKV